MKSVTEFANFTLAQGLKTKTALASEGKTPEEIQTSLGESFKLEGDRLKHFVNAIDVAGQNTTNLRRVVVVSLAEGENAPAKAVQVEEHHYIPEFLIEKSAAPAATDKRGGKGRGGRGGGQDKKGSPWGLSPEQKAEKKKGPAPKPN